MCPVSSGVHYWNTKGKVAVSGCIRPETNIRARQGVQDYLGLLFSAQYLLEPWAWDGRRGNALGCTCKSPSTTTNAHVTVLLRRQQLIHMLFQQVRLSVFIRIYYYFFNILFTHHFFPNNSRQSLVNLDQSLLYLLKFSHYLSNWLFQFFLWLEDSCR